MAILLSTKAILDGVPITLFNRDHTRHDFTDVDDVTLVIGRLIGHVRREAKRLVGVDLQRR